MRKENASFNTKFISEPGSYIKNADYFAFVELKDYACYVIADGIDTDEKKESAKLAVTTVITAFSDAPGLSGEKLKEYIRAAHQALLQEADEIRLEASILILVTDYKKAVWAHSGNCRLYWMKNGAIKLVTKDTSLSQKLVDEEEVPMDQLAYHEERNNLYSYLGQPGHLAPVVSAVHKLEDGDIFIMQTRGVWENVGNAELIDAIDGVSKPEEVCTGLEDVILSQRLQIVENYTIATVFVDKIYKNPKAGKYKKFIKIGVAIFIAVFMIVLMLSITRINSNKQNYAKVLKTKEKGIEYLIENNYESANKQFEEANESAEDVKVTKASKKYKTLVCVELYGSMSEDLTIAMQALKEGEYKKAEKYFNSANDIVQTLKNEQGEDVTEYAEGVSAYVTFASMMTDGSSYFSKTEYEKAAEKFTDAAKEMDDICDVENRDIADEYRNSANAKMSMLSGIQFEKDGDDNEKQDHLSKALTQYKSAREMYVLAKEEFKSTDADAKVAQIDIKIDNLSQMMKQQTNQEKEKEADEYMSMGVKADHNGNREEALEYYEQAKAIYMETGNQEQIAYLNQKMENSQFGSDEEEAIMYVMNALDALAGGDTATAKNNLQKAKDAYTKLGDTVRVNEIQTILSKIQ